MDFQAWLRMDDPESRCVRCAHCRAVDAFRAERVSFQTPGSWTWTTQGAPHSTSHCGGAQRHTPAEERAERATHMALVEEGVEAFLRAHRALAQQGLHNKNNLAAERQQVATHLGWLRAAWMAFQEGGMAADDASVWLQGGAAYVSSPPFPGTKTKHTHCRGCLGLRPIGVKVTLQLNWERWKRQVGG